MTTSESATPVCLVSGGGKNLGREICRRMAAAGYDVALTYVSDAASAESVANEVRALGRRALAVRVDTSVSAQVEAGVAEVVARVGPVEVLVNNAAVRPRRPLLDLSDEDWAYVLGINLNGAFYLSRAVAASMMAARRGSLIHISGLIAFLGGRGGGAHIATSKAGLSGLSRALADELGPYGVRSNVVVPARMQTEKAEGVDPGKVADEIRATPMGRIATVGDVAGMCVFLASPAAAFVSGQMLHVNGGIYKG